MSPVREDDTELFERVARVEQQQENCDDNAQRRHSEILVAIGAMKADVLLHIDERIGAFRETCAIRHCELERRLADDRSSKATAKQYSLSRLALVVSVISALLGGVGGASINCVAQRAHVAHVVQP